MSRPRGKKSGSHGVRAVVDTNVWVSALINPSGAPAEVLTAYRAGAFTLVTSEEMLAEVGEVLARPRIARKYGIEAADIARPQVKRSRTSNST